MPAGRKVGENCPDTASKQERKRKKDNGAAAAERKEWLFVYGILFKFQRHAGKTEIKNTNKSVTDNYLGRTVIP